MTTHVLTLEEIKYRTVEEFLRFVSSAQEVFAILLPNGAEVLIHPKPTLPSLPVLDGYVPSGWKQAIYDYAD